MAKKRKPSRREISADELNTVSEQPPEPDELAAAGWYSVAASPVTPATEDVPTAEPSAPPTWHVLVAHDHGTFDHIEVTTETELVSQLTALLADGDKDLQVFVFCGHRLFTTRSPYPHLVLLDGRRLPLFNITPEESLEIDDMSRSVPVLTAKTTADGRREDELEKKQKLRAEDAEQDEEEMDDEDWDDEDDEDEDDDSWVDDGEDDEDWDDEDEEWDEEDDEAVEE